MRLHPDAAAVLQRVRDAGIPPWHTMTAERGREVFRQRALLFGGEKQDAGDVRDAAIAAPGRAIPLRLYRPPARGPRPVFVYLHGGGWTLGDLDTVDHLCRRIAVATGALVVSVAYRLAPEHRHAEQLEDVLAAIDWVREHAAEHGGDPARIAVGGDSAGGNLAAGAALRLRDEGRPNFGLQVLTYAATVPYFDTLSYHVNAEGYWLTRRDCIWFWDNFLGPDPAARRDPYACPGIVDDLRDLPPAVVITAAFDPLRDEGEVYALKLRSAGVPVTARRFAGMIHGFVALPTPIPAGTRAIALIADAMRRTWPTAARPATRGR